ncbi:MAG: hypothetical protein M3Z59_07080 [Bombella apis]|nr:hypothetical protein [Bombella apis]
MRIFAPGWAVRYGVWPCFLACALVLSGCAREDDEGQSHRHLPKADMTEAYPKKPFREVHHPPPVYWGGMVPVVQTIQPTPDEISGRAPRSAAGGAPGVPMAPPETRTDVMYGAPEARQKP